jgi:subtilisin family serine protease
MTELRESAAGNEYIEGNSILVSSQDVAPVVDMLKDKFGILVDQPDSVKDPDNGEFTDPRLGLTKVELLPFDKLTPDEFRKLTENAPEMFFQGGGEFAMDAVLGALRAAFREENAGWAPTMGKNRTLSSIEGGVIIRRDDEPPTPSGPPANASWANEVPAEKPVRVGLLDTPFITPGHDWLARRVTDLDSLMGRETAEPTVDGDPDWRTGHSTFLAGLIASQAPGAQIVVADGLSAHGTGSSWDVARRIADFADWNATAPVEQRVSVLNISSGAFTFDGESPLALATAVAILGPEVVVVAAAGNHGDDTRTKRGGRNYLWAKRPLFPAACAPVIAVGSAKRNDQRSDFSPQANWVDVIAWGEELVSSYLSGNVAGFRREGQGEDVEDVLAFDGYAKWSGTSFATALVSGAIAGRMGPGVSARQAWRELRNELVGPDRFLPLNNVPVA